MRGEERSLSVDGRGAEGSPPHARGREVGCFLVSGAYGITPACAGKSL